VPNTARGWLHKVGNGGVIKLVVDRTSGLLVGATSVGPAGGEVLGALSVAVHARVLVSTLQSMMYAYPTFHRGIEDALRDLSESPAAPGRRGHHRLTGPTGLRAPRNGLRAPRNLAAQFRPGAAGMSSSVPA